MKYLILLLFPIMIITFSCKDEVVQPNEYGSGNNYIIYEKIIQNQFAETDYFIILDDTTRGEYIDTFHVRNLYERIPALLEETLNDYLLRKDNRVKLKKILNIKSICFSSEINNRPNNSVNVWLSDIGYNKSENQAIVTMGEIFGPEAGGGVLFFLSKENGEWNVKSIYGLWTT